MVSGSQIARTWLVPLAALIALASGGARVLAAQQVPVSGRVVDSTTSEPVAGANIVIKGTTIGAIASSTGEFHLRARSLNDTLDVRSLGYAQQLIALNGRSSVVVSLAPVAAGLPGMVTVGYGTQKRADVTGAVASVTPARLTTEPTTNVAESLEGAVPGLVVTTNGSSAEGNFSILVRGQNSITASNTPLVVVDGIPYGGSLSELNPAEIQSIDVLKDASAAAIYGARGSNGVILITTRRGHGKPAFAYSGHVGTANAVDVPRMMTGPEFGVFKCEHLNDGVPCTPDQITTSLTASELANYQAGNTTDWVGLATRTAIQQQQTLSFAGGTDQTQYYLSGGLLNNQGVARNNDYRRYDMRVNLEQQMNSWMSVGTSTQLGLVNRSGVAASFGDAFVQNPLNSAFAADGSQLVYPWPEDVFFSNPLEGLLATDNDDSRRVFTSNHLQIDLPFVQGLSFRVNGGIDYEDRRHGTYYGRNTKTGLSNQGLATTSSLDRYEWTLENLLRYQRSFGQHAVDVTGLFSQESNKFENDGLRSAGFPNDVLTYYQANVGQVITPSYSYSKSGLVSQMLRLNYNYADRILATATVRRDGFSGFGSSHKYGVFPSLALGWNLARESFWPLPDKLSTFKLRVSWGENGNEAIRPYQTLATLGQLSYVDGNTTAPGYIPVSLANPDLRWESTAQTNVGADFGFLRDRITGSLDLYWSRTHDLLLYRSISPVEGISSVLQNIGKTANRGIELGLTSHNIDGKRFSWETNFNIAANRNRIIDLYGNGESDVANGWFIGHPIDVNYGYAFGGIWQTTDDIANSAQPTAKPGDVRIRDLNGDGKIDASDRTFLGSLQPSYTAGMTNTLRYGKVTLAAFLNTVQGVKRANPLLSPTVVGPQVRYNTIVEQYWTPDNPINSYPANREGVNPLSVGFYQNSSYVRLQDVMLGVDLPRSAWLGSVNRLRLYVDGKNLWTATKWTGLDPEFTSSNQRGIPLARTIILGLDLGF